MDTADKKRPKKAKIKGQNSCFNSVDNLNKKKAKINYVDSQKKQWTH